MNLSGTVALILSFLIPQIAIEPLRPVGEQRIRAAFLYNFAKFVEWPSTVFSNSTSPFIFCMAGDGLQRALEDTIQGETLGGRPLAMRAVTGLEDIRSCHILFVSQSQGHRTTEILAAVANAPVLTVGETPTFIANGGIVRFTRAGNRVRFEINPDAAERASLRVSSRLLRLADVVRLGGKQ